jgi:hypothetical protein
MSSGRGPASLRGQKGGRMDSKSYDHIVPGINGIVTPTKHDMVGRLDKCACGIPTNAEKCGVCYAEERAGLSLRVFKK